MKRLYLLLIETYWKIEHIHIESIACFGYRKRKLWEHKYCDRFNENIYGQPL